jgi:gas vesicle protein
MFDEDESDSGTRIVLFMTGMMLGAAAALLLAPQSGRKSRAQLVKYGQNVRERVGDNIEEIGDRAGDMINKAGETFNRAMEKGREYVQGEGRRGR